MVDDHLACGGKPVSYTHLDVYKRQVLDLVDEVYQRLRTHLRVRKTFFTDLQALTRYLYFASWEQLLNFMYVQLELDQPATSRRRRS